MFIWTGIPSQFRQKPAIRLVGHAQAVISTGTMSYSDWDDDEESSASSSDSEELRWASNLNEFQLHKDYLPTLYRVQLPTSATNHHPSIGFTARSTTLFHNPSLTPVSSIADALTEHLNWRSTVRSPFISVPDDEDHARNWALAWLKAHYDQECTMYEIDPKELADTSVFETDELINVLELYVPAHVNVDGEYLVLHTIPEEAIQTEQDVSAEDWDSDEGTNEEDSEESDDEESDECSDSGYY